VRRFQIFTLFAAEIALERDVQHPEQSVHRRAQFVRHIGQEVAFRLARGERRAHRVFQLFGALPDALFEQIAMLLDLAIGALQLLDHKIEAVAEVFDFVVRLADLNRFKFSFANRSDALPQ
jgi:hypothetical protein